jgi:Mrp family chromosome partitioning ATPase
VASIYTFARGKEKTGKTTVSANVATALAGARSQFSGVFDPDHFTRILFQASVIHGFVTGIVAARWRTYRSAGLRHSLLLTIMAWTTFTFLI